MPLMNKATRREIIQCRQCGMPFHSAGGRLCPNCLGEIESGFRKVANFLSTGDARIEPNVNSVSELTEKTGVVSWIILQLLREKRIAMHKPLEGGVTCQYCRKPIALGDACDDCKNKLAEQLMKSRSNRVSTLSLRNLNKYGVR